MKTWQWLALMALVGAIIFLLTKVPIDRTEINNLKREYAKRVYEDSLRIAELSLKVKTSDSTISTQSEKVRILKGKLSGSVQKTGDLANKIIDTLFVTDCEDLAKAVIEQNKIIDLTEKSRDSLENAYEIRIGQADSAIVFQETTIEFRDSIINQLSLSYDKALIENSKVIKASKFNSTLAKILGGALVVVSIILAVK